MDFEYNGYTFSMPGGGVVRLSDVLTALNIPCEVSSLTKVVSSNTDVLVVTHAETDASEFEMYMAAHGLTEVMEAINAGLYADETEDETAGEFKDRIVSAGDWIVFSIAPFDTQETLTLVADNGTTYVVGFTDPASDGEFDITSMLTDVTLVIDGRDVTGNTWQVEEGQTYNLKLKFAETDFSQFPNSGTMYYQLPSGIYTENYSRTFDVKIRMNGKTYMLPGNTFTVNTDGEVRIQWNTEHPMYRYLLYSGNTSITLNLTGMFQKNTTQVIFSDTVTKTIEVKEIHDVSVTKQSTYNAATGKIHYVVQVTSAGENRPVSVHDTLGTALKIDGNVTITSNKGNMPSHTGSVKADNTGFDYTFGDASSGGLRDGEIITIEYDAVIDYDKIGKSGNATFNETKNVVNAEYPNDDNPGDNEASTYESNISFSTFGKDAVTMGNVYTEKEGDVDVMYRDITWKITANEDHSVSMEGSTFKDVNNSSNVMKYKGEGITVVITAPGNQATATETISYASMDYHSDQGWGWTVPDEAPFKGKQKYEITYTTKVRIGDGSQNISVQNYAEGKGGSDSEQVPVWTGTGTVTPGPTGSGEPGPTPPPEIVANKAVTKSTADYVDWKITVMIPAEGYNDDFFVVDTLPSVYFNSQYVYDTYDSTTGVNVNGLVDGETYNVTDEDATVKIQFYDNDQDSPKGLKGTGASRVLTISLRTLVNQDWYDYAEEHGSYYWQHKNKATITANGATKETSAEAAPKRKSIKKVVQSTNNTFTDDNGITHRAFLYQIVLSSVDRDQIVINEVFDSSLKICPNNNNPDYRNLRVMGGNSYGPMSEQEFAAPTYATVQETATGARLIIDVPKKSGTFADYYYIEYYLYVANEELAVAKAQSNDGVALLGNTATWDGIPGHADVEYSYNGVGKSATQVYETDENGQQVPTDRFNYTIVLNPDKVRLNDGNNMIMTDTFTNLAIDYSSIKITFDPAQTGDYPFDYSGNVGTFTIPDETKVTITYQARIIGGQEGETITATNTAEMYGFMDSSTVSHTFSADAEGEGRVPSIRVLKYGENNMGQPFEGAVFQLYDANKQVITYPADAANGKAGQPVKFTTVSTDQKDLNGEVILNKGYALVTLVEHGENADGMTLQFDTVYYLREVEAPTINGVEYAVDNTYYQFQISSNDTADYDNFIYMDGDILKIRNYPKRYELKLAKKLNLPQGATMNDSQRANIRFEIKSVDTNGNSNGAYRKVVYFNNFDYDSVSQTYIYRLQDVPAGTYRVTEYGDDVYDYHLTAASVEYVEDGNDGTPAPSVVTPVGEESTPTIQFTMSQENGLAEVKYTNNYEVRHTYYFTKVEQGNTSIRVPGTTFTVYNAGDNTPVGEPYLTDENGKFFIYMDDGHNYQSDTLYYVMETQANPDYVLPDDPPKYYFYFGGTVTAPNGITPVNLGAASARQTVENEIKTVDIPVKKTWVDVVNMPASVTVKLLRRLVDSGDPWEETDKTLVLTPDENDDTKDWKDSFENLDKDYEYKVEEVIPEGVYYAATYANNDGVKEQSADKTIEIINTTTLKNITVHKIWVDEPADDPNYQRPTAYFTLQVKKPDEGEWVNADNNGFAALYDGTWNNTEFNAIVKDKIDLYRSITSENASCEWTNLPGRFIYRVVETDSNHNAYAEGQKIDEGKYVVTYDNAYTDGVSQGDVLITNTYSFTSLKVKKLWNTADVAPNSVYVSLYRNALFGETATYPASNPVWIGVPYSSYNTNIRTIELKKSENFQGEFTNLEKGYVYHLVETPVDGYTTTISDGNIYYGGETVTITNTKYTTDDKAIQVKKLWYDTEGNPMTDNLPDHVDVELKRIEADVQGYTVNLYYNTGTDYGVGNRFLKKAFVVKANSNIEFDFIQWRGTNKGSSVSPSNAATATVDFDNHKAMISNITGNCDVTIEFGSYVGDGLTIISMEQADIVPKTGDDGLPKSIVGGVVNGIYTTQSLNSGNNWAYKWTNLPADDGNGTAYLYTIEEKAVVDGQGNSHIQDYQLTIDDGNHGEGVPTGVIFLKNTKIPNGSLKLKKLVTVGGASTQGTVADGAYRFDVKKGGTVVKYVWIMVEDGVMTKYMISDKLAEDSNDGEHYGPWYDYDNCPERVKDVQGDWVTVDGLVAGSYTVEEYRLTYKWWTYSREEGEGADGIWFYNPYIGATLVGDNDISLIVEPGNTVAPTAQATFTNNVQTGSLKLTKLVVDKDGAAVTNNRADGSYVFKVKGPSPSEEVIKWVKIWVENGQAKKYNFDTNASKNDPQTQDIPEGGYVVISDLPVGTYVIEELFGDLDRVYPFLDNRERYVAELDKVTVDDVEQTETPITVSVETGSTPTVHAVAVTNKITEKPPTEITVKKIWLDANGDEITDPETIWLNAAEVCFSVTRIKNHSQGGRKQDRLTFGNNRDPYLTITKDGRIAKLTQVGDADSTHYNVEYQNGGDSWTTKLTGLNRCGSDNYEDPYTISELCVKDAQGNVIAGYKTTYDLSGEEEEEDDETHFYYDGLVLVEGQNDEETGFGGVGYRDNRTVIGIGLIRDGGTAYIRNQKVETGKLKLKKEALADTSLDVSQTDGNYAFVVEGPTGGTNILRKYVIIKTVDGEGTAYMTGDLNENWTVNDIPAWSDAGSQTLTDDRYVVFNDLVPGEYTVSEVRTVLDSTTDQAVMCLYDINVPNHLGNSVDISNRIAKMYVGQGEIASADMVFKNKLIPIKPVIRKMVIDINDSIETQGPDYHTEHTFNDSADYDIGDDVPYRITTNLPSEYYRSADTTKYFYELYDEMTHTKLKDWKMYAFVKTDEAVNGETGKWYDVTDSFAVNRSEYENGKQTIIVYPNNPDRDLLKVTSKKWVSNWGDDNTHVYHYPYVNPETTVEEEVFGGYTSREIRYLQFRYTATLMNDATIGSVGNPNDTWVKYENGTDQHGETEKDRNKVFTYRLAFNKVDDDDNKLTGASFELYKKYLPANRGNAGNIETYFEGDTSLPSGKYVDDNNNEYILAGPADRMPQGVVDYTATNSDNIYVLVKRISDDDYDFVWNGIDDGEYLLFETAAPKGYKPIASPIAITITAGHQREADDPQMTSFDFRATGAESGWFTVNTTETTIEGGEKVVTVDPNSVTGAIPNTPYSGIQIIKIDERTREAATVKFLQGAEFTLYKWTGSTYAEYAPDGVVGGTKSATVTTDENGFAAFSKLEPGEYKISETKMPAGYIKAVVNDIFFRVDYNEQGEIVVTRYKNEVKIDPTTKQVIPRTEEEVISVDVASTAEFGYVTRYKTGDTWVGINDSAGDVPPTFIVGNMPGTSLPSTGGPGTTMFYVVGSILTLLAAVLLITKRRTDGQGID